MQFWLMISAIVAAATWFLASGNEAKESVVANGLAHPAGWSKRLVIFTVCCAVLGLIFRLVGIGASLWTDEFGTLWAVQGDLATTFVRSQSFHGQSPLYYSIIWTVVQLFGESEIALRLPSVLFMIGAAILIYKIGVLLMDVPCGVFSAALLWLSVGGLRLTTEARPYGLAIFFTTLAFYGFLLATKTGNGKGRALFVIGGAGLVAAHYVLAVILLGVGVSYLAFDGLRRNYSVRKFALDVFLQVVLSIPAARQLFTLWGRKANLSWIDHLDFSVLLDAFRPELVLLIAALTACLTLSRQTLKNSTVGLLAICAVAPPVVLIVLAQLGTKLTADRYILGILVPLCLLISYTVSRVPLKLGVFGWLGWGFYSLAWLGSAYAFCGSFSGIGRFDWRTAVAQMNEELRAAPGVPVLYRSGFIEDDLVLRGQEVPGAVWAPLRSPGHAQPHWDTILVGHDWIADGREEYFRNIVKVAVSKQRVVYYLSCDCWGGPRSAHYDEHLEQWVARELPRYKVTRIPAGVGMVILKFERSDSPPSPSG